MVEKCRDCFFYKKGGECDNDLCPCYGLYLSEEFCCKYYISLKKQRTININLSYLTKFVDPKKEYPVSYHIDQNGNIINEPIFLYGYDLTENQIFELFENELL